MIEAVVKLLLSENYCAFLTSLNFKCLQTIVIRHLDV